MCVAPEGRRRSSEGPEVIAAAAFLQPWGWIKACVYPGPVPGPTAAAPHISNSIRVGQRGGFKGSQTGLW